MLPQSKPRNKQLDDREASIKKRELALIRRETELNEPMLLSKIEILNKQIVQKEGAKLQLDKDIQSLSDMLDSAKESNNNELYKLKCTLELKSKEITSLEASRHVIGESIKSYNTKLKEIKQDINDQTTYLSSQQVLMEETINNWNDQLKEFQNADMEVKNNKAVINAEILRLEQDKTIMEDGCKEIEEKNIELDRLYNEKSRSYKDELKSIKKQISDGEQTLLELEQKNKARIETIESRIQSLLIRERAVQKSELELSSREKKLNMRLGLSKVSIDDMI